LKSGSYSVYGKEANTCTCQHGTPAAGAACTANGRNICASCGAGFHKSGTSCKANTCTCRHGTPSAGAACKSNSAATRAKCQDGFHMNASACKQNVCTCDSGEGTHGTDCPTNGRPNCTSCQNGFFLVNNADEHVCQKSSSCRTQLSGIIILMLMICRGLF